MGDLTAANVSAVIVTRGDGDLRPVLDSLIFDDVVVWDNSRESRDEMTYGRVLATARCRHTVIYSQDDDIIHTRENQQRILAAYQPGILTGCMWPEWSDGARKQGIENGYDDLVFCGSGSVYDSAVVWEATARYLATYPLDDFFRLWCDTLVGVISPTQQLNIRFDALPCADADNRMANMADAVALKTQAIYRARAVRDALAAGVAA